LPVFGQLIAVVLAVLSRSTSAEFFQLLGVHFQLAVFPQHFEFVFQIVYLGIHGCKGSSVKQYYLALHSAFAYAVKMELIPKHPMDKLVVPRADRHEATFYNGDELTELLEVFKEDKLELVVNIAAYYGLRRCEILGLRWDAIDFKNKTITIQRKIVSDYDDSGEMKLYVETRLKTNSTRRTLPLIPHIEEMLLEKKAMEAKFKKACGKSYNKEFDGFICRDNLGNMISPSYVTQHFHYIVTKSGMKHLRFHDLRHSCASLLLANDIPMKAIQEWLGHSNFAITANLYSHLEYNAKVNSAETIARVLGGNPAPKSEPEKTATKKTTAKTTSDTAPKKTRGRKKKSDNPDGTGESQRSTL
jgi:integrase